MSVVIEAEKEAIRVLRSLSTEKGFVASTTDRDNYYRVWGRDGVIAILAALATGEEDLINTSRLTLETLTHHQDKTGRIASNVSLDGKKISYGTTVGRIDATLWYVIGMVRYATVTEDVAFLDTHKENVERAFFYLECLELNGRGLLYIPQGGDWADEYAQDGYVLFDQLLYLIALTLYGNYSGIAHHKEKASLLRDIIRINYGPKEEYKDSSLVYHKTLYAKMIESYIPPTPLASFSPHRIYRHKDIFAISLFMMLGLADKEACRDIVDNLDKECTGTNFPIVPAFCPVIQEDDPDWKMLEGNFLFRFKNKPFEFHNGGRWPLVHGFYLSSGNHDLSVELEEFASILSRDNYSFPEFYHGRDCVPMGIAPLGFSAAGYLIAHHAILNHVKPFGNIV
ncbi:MAG: glycogen debranching protein [Candidatus Paceibacterota bacterium]